jgi:hypothetical protein
VHPPLLRWPRAALALCTFGEAPALPQHPYLIPSPCSLHRPLPPTEHPPPSPNPPAPSKTSYRRQLNSDAPDATFTATQVASRNAQFATYPTTREFFYIGSAGGLNGRRLMI